MIPTYEELIIKLENIPNARQLGGYTNKYGRKVKNNKLIRTGSLSNATDSDIKKLSEEIGIKTIFDLRSDIEISNQKDKEIPGAGNIQLDLLLKINNQAIKSVFMDKNLENSKEHPVIRMCRNPILIEYITHLYSRLLSDEHAQALYHKMFELTLATKGAPILWHCTYGKDRTGLGALLILSALDVDIEIIKEDFLRTNIAYKEEINMLLETAQKENFSEQQLWAVKSMAGVAEESFDAAMKTINENFGGMNNYLHNQIKLTNKDIELFKEYYLE